MKRANQDFQKGRKHNKRFIPKYTGMKTHQARNLAIREASGECWWIETFLRYNTFDHNRRIDKDES
jgi:hypothetical protein